MLSKRYPNQYKKQHKKRYKRCYDFEQTIIYKYTPITKDVHHRFAIIPKGGFILPRTTIPFFRRHFKKFLKRRHIDCIFKIRPNYTISCKNKNSRMGKGVGSLSRLTFRVNKHQPFIYTFNASQRRAELIAGYLTKRLNTSFFIRQLS